MTTRLAHHSDKDGDAEDLDDDEVLVALYAAAAGESASELGGESASELAQRGQRGLPSVLKAARSWASKQAVLHTGPRVPQASQDGGAGDDDAEDSEDGGLPHQTWNHGPSYYT